MQSKNSPTDVKYSKLTQQTKEIKNYIFQLRTKLTNMLRGKERKKRKKSRYVKLNRGR